MNTFYSLHRLRLETVAENFPGLPARADQYTDALNVYRDIRKVYTLDQIIRNRGLNKVRIKKQLNQKQPSQLYRTCTCIESKGVLITLAKNNEEALSRLNKMVPSGKKLTLFDISVFKNE